MKKFSSLLFLIFALLFLSCSSEGFNSTSQSKKNTGPAKADFTLCSWNLQTFFDGVTDGCEYSNFKSSAKWNQEKYEIRLKRLCQVLKSLDADIFALEEIENEGIIQDIANYFAGNSWNADKNWNYASFSKSKGSAIGCAIISRYPLYALKNHSLDIRSEDSSQPSMRPIMEVCADVKGREVVIFVNHWKSKAGGGESSQVWRKWQEKVLAGRILEVSLNAGPACIICGDFNQDSEEFQTDFTGFEKGWNTIFDDCVKVYSPWYEADGSYATEIGSYYYGSQWERIDHIFSFGKAEISDFSPKAESPWANENGLPLSYKIYTGEGYSDHLPVMAKICIK